MTKWTVLASALYGAVFALSFLIESFGSTSTRALIGLFLFGFYVMLVWYGTVGQRTLALWMQTGMGVLLALAIAGLCGVQGVAWLYFAGAGVVLGYTADVWMRWIPYP